MKLKELLEDYDWKEAFVYALNPTPTIGCKCSKKSIRIEDVIKIIRYEEGENDGQDWLMVFKTKDGRYAFLEAGCDYTGWDCQAGGYTIVSDNLEDLYKYGLTDEARARLFKKR